MFVVREVFTAKPGNGSKLAKFFKETMKDMPGPKPRVLTDVVSNYNTVVMEFEFRDLNEFTQMMKEFGDKPEVRERMKGYTDMWDTGRREIFQTVD